MVDLNNYVNNVARIADALERLADAKDAGAVALPKTTATAKKEVEAEW